MFPKLFKIRNNLFYVSIIFFLQIGLPLNKILADDIYIAVASNFLTPLNSLKKSFETQNKAKIFISSGSSGSLYSQIINGAPLDIFLSGDQKLPKKIEFSQKGIKGSRFTYATGKLLIFTTNKFLFDKNFPQVLTSNNIKYIGIGNPKYVPYGNAAQQVLRSLNVFDKLLPRLILSKNVNQVFIMSYFGNLDLGFISKSDFIIKNQKGKVWEVPQSLYSPIKQDAVLLNNGKRKKEAIDFLSFLASEHVREKLKKFGYVFN